MSFILDLLKKLNPFDRSGEQYQSKLELPGKLSYDFRLSGGQEQDGELSREELEKLGLPPDAKAVRTTHTVDLGSVNFNLTPGAETSSEVKQLFGGLVNIMKTGESSSAKINLGEPGSVQRAAEILSAIVNAMPSGSNQFNILTMGNQGKKELLKKLADALRSQGKTAEAEALEKKITEL